MQNLLFRIYIRTLLKKKDKKNSPDEKYKRDPKSKKELKRQEIIIKK